VALAGAGLVSGVWGLGGGGDGDVEAEGLDLAEVGARLLWQQVYDDILNDIRSAVLATDDRLPSEFDMAEQYGVSRDVIRRAKEELASQGWLIVLQGRGTFVANPEQSSQS